METTIREPQIRMRRLGVVRLIAFGSVIGVIALFAVGMVNCGRARSLLSTFPLARYSQIHSFANVTFNLTDFLPDSTAIR